jgi:hypothetical protein
MAARVVTRAICNYWQPWRDEREVFSQIEKSLARSSETVGADDREVSRRLANMQCTTNHASLLQINRSSAQGSDVPSTNTMAVRLAS